MSNKNNHVSSLKVKNNRENELKLLYNTDLGYTD